MRLRCPRQNCPLDLPDEMLGQLARCPHCGNEFVVALGHRDLTLDDGEAEDGNSEDATPIEHRLYDGLPPLSVMLAIRAGRPLDDRAAEAMTDDDWKALAAFESALAAVAHISTALWLGTIAVGLHVFYAYLQFDDRQTVHALTPMEIVGWILFPIFVGAMLWVTRTARDLLAQAFTDRWWVRSVPWLSFFLALAFAGAAIWLTRYLFGDRRSAITGADFLVLVCDFLAILPCMIACWSSLSAVEKISPPEIARRLQDALAYLK